jgi:hypothetical protein
MKAAQKKVIFLQQNIIMVLSRAYQKFSSNKIHLAEEEPKQVEHRQIQTDPAFGNKPKLPLPTE